jgi:hypothetical protein
MKINALLSALTGAVSAVLVMTAAPSWNLIAKQTSPSTPGPVGAWFGIARSCNTPSRFPQPPNTVDQDICQQSCGIGRTCPVTTFPVDEVTMMPEIFGDGNVVATDHATLVDGHPIGQGRWEPTGKVTIAGKSYDRVSASFMWFQPKPPQDVDPNHPFSKFAGMAHPRFVMFFDPTNPDIMKGFLQPYLFSITNQFGIVNLQPGTPFPTPDPIPPLPEVCDPSAKTNPYCFGTFMFVIRRIQPR